VPLRGEPVRMEEFTSCSVCSRTPLVGEEMALIGDGSRESAVCDLCLERPRAAALGEILRRERVRSTEGAATVARAWPTPAGESVELATAR
jgi:hypothetical protein